MTTRAKTIMLAFTMVSVLATPFAEAARLGKGKSAGMQRSAPPVLTNNKRRRARLRRLRKRPLRLKLNPNPARASAPR